MANQKIKSGIHCDLLPNTLDCDTKVSKLKIQSQCDVHFQTNTLRE